MLYQAAVACTDAMTEEEIASGRTFPAISRIRDVSHGVACAVIRVALEAGLTSKLSAEQVPTPEVTLTLNRTCPRPEPRLQP